MPKIKICGIKRMEDVCCVNKFLPEYIGFIFAESRRRVTVEQAKTLGQALDKRIKRVGVFVDSSLEEVVDTASKCSLDVVQIHGGEASDYVEKLKDALGEANIDIWKAVRVKDEKSIELMREYRADAFVLDAYVEGSHGGAGKTFDWSLAKEAGKYGRIILAGGLTPLNAWTAAELVKPFALDVSSGVETNGFKDEVKIRDFIHTVRSRSG